MMEEVHLDLDSPNDTLSSPSSSFYQSSPLPSTKSSTIASKLSIADLSYSIIPTSCHLKRKPKSEPICALRSVSFAANSSEILAIVGPSGAGKSTLLRIISGRIKKSEFDPLAISFNDRNITSPNQLRKICGFVTQEDNLLPLLTVKETLMFSARFKLRGLSSRERMDRVDVLIRELGLERVVESYVGDAETRGISGGERKRLSIGVDVIHDPPILLLDEPTSGLDSTSALQVIELLASMAVARQQVLLLTIHQPGYRILRYITSFVLLSRGTAVHCGSLESLEERISQMGFKIPAQINTLEFAMEITGRLLEENEQRPREPVVVIADDPLELNDNEWEDDGYSSRFNEVNSLCWRFWKIIYRTKQLFLARTMQAVVGGFALGSVYLKVRKDPNGVAERLGFFAFSLSFLLSSTVEALPIFLQERRVLMRESSRRMYRLSSYMFSNALVYMPFLLAVALLYAAPVYWLVGLNPSPEAFLFFVMVVWMILMMASSLVLFLSAVSSDVILGNSLICMFLGVFFLFSGYFIPKESIPKYWVFMYYVSLYRYPLDSLLVNEYWSRRGECFSWGGDQCLLSGADVLRRRGLLSDHEEDRRWINVAIMCGFFLIYRFLGWIVLVRKASTTML